MAWRDSRTHRKRLFLFISSIIVGIAALVAITSLGENVEESVNQQAKVLLGADLVINSQQQFGEPVVALFDSLGGSQSKMTSFTSMAYFPKNAGTRLVFVRAIDGDFPFYGELETVPEEAADTYMNGRNALVHESLMLQFNVEVGDIIQIGATDFRIAGVLKKIPGEAQIGSIFGPRVYIPGQYLEETRLLQAGSLAFYQVYFKFDRQRDIEALAEEIKPKLIKHRLTSDTVESRKADLGQAMENFYRFLSLIGFIALILGSIGVASAIHVYVRHKLDTVAILRCLGAKAKQAFWIYLIQAGAIGLVGSIIGAALGVIIQTLLPAVVGDLMPVSIEVQISWWAILQGMIIGLGMAILLAMIPLISVRRISPLLALRQSFETGDSPKKDPLRLWIYLVIVIAITSFSIMHSQEWRYGIAFAAALAIAFGLIVGASKLVMKLIRKYFPSSWSYVWRQSLANLFRPNNQTTILMLSLGLGAFLIATLYLVHNTLLKEVEINSSGNKPNMILFDIQTDQIDGVENLVRSFELPVIEKNPIVSMRIAEIKGRTYEEIRNDSTSTISRWSIRREYRTTYRDSLTDAEKLIAGKFHKPVRDPSDSIFVSIEEDIAENLKVKPGDEVVFDIQGVPVKTVVGSLRKVNWRRIRTNFFIIFPTGVLEDAPQMHALITRVATNQESAELQRALVREFPNVSAIDLSLVFSTLDSVLSKIGFVIRFMASFSIFTGLIVLVGAVSISRYQRIQESVLLRTLGASRKQVVKITMLEYLFLGSLAVFTGLILSLGGSWALAHFVFEAPFSPAILPILVISVVVVGLTILLGMLNSRGIVDKPPLEVLRVEV
jgi:putative ABC transport system permease protein